MDLPSGNLGSAEKERDELLKGLPPFEHRQLTDDAMRKIRKHLLPYDWRQPLDNALYEILSYIPGTGRPRNLICSVYSKARLSIPRELLRACRSVPLEATKLLINFNHINYAIKSYAIQSRYETKSPKPPIARLSNEILIEILNRLSPHSGTAPPPEHPASLSVESLATNANTANTANIVCDTRELISFGLTCWKFRELAQEHLFVQITIRFSSEGFEKLRYIAERTPLALSVKKFSFMMPQFYSQDQAQFQALLQEFNEPVQATQELERRRNQHRQEPRLTMDNHNKIIKTMQKAYDQQRIIGSSIDKKGLEFALAKFENLQQVRLMKVNDEVDRGWDRFLERYPRYRNEFMAEDWATSCEHAAKLFNAALMRTKNTNLARFSSRFMEPSLPLIITQTIRSTISSLAARMLYLELEFVDQRSHQQERMAGLSELFGLVFRSAINLQCLHIGFRNRTSAPLSLLFHDVHFRCLRHLGLHMWNLDSDELIGLLRRHQDTLRSIRLRHVSLEQTSDERNWEKVLRFVRSTFPTLKWIRLRGIGYNLNTSATTHPMGGVFFLPAYQQYALASNNDESDDSDSNNLPEVEREDEDDAMAQHYEDSSAESASDQHDSDEPGSSHDGEEDEEHDDHDSDLEEEHYDLSFDHNSSANSPVFTDDPPRIGPDTHLQCECGNGKFGWHDLNDNGVSVSRTQWKEWQEWVKKSCFLHDPRETT